MSAGLWFLTWPPKLNVDGSKGPTKLMSFAAAMLASRQRVFPRIVADDALVTWSHARFPGWGRIVAAGDGYRWQPFD